MDTEAENNRTYYSKIGNEVLPTSVFAGLTFYSAYKLNRIPIRSNILLGSLTAFGLGYFLLFFYYFLIFLSFLLFCYFFLYLASIRINYYDRYTYLAYRSFSEPRKSRRLAIGMYLYLLLSFLFFLTFP